MKKRKEKALFESKSNSEIRERYFHTKRIGRKTAKSGQKRTREDFKCGKFSREIIGRGFLRRKSSKIEEDLGLISSKAIDESMNRLMTIDGD